MKYWMYVECLMAYPTTRAFQISIGTYTYIFWSNRQVNVVPLFIRFFIYDF